MTSDTKIAKQISASLKYSIKDASWWSVMAAFGESYLSAFAVFLQATSLQMGIFTAIPQLVSALAQLIAIRVTDMFKSRKMLVVFFSTVQALMWALIPLISYFAQNVWVLIILTAIYYVVGAIQGPVWNSWMGDLVPPSKRGRYFGKRNSIAGVFSAVSMIIAGLVLQGISQFNEMIAFVVLFIVASAARMLSTYYLSLKYHPEVEIRPPKKMSLHRFFHEFKDTNYGWLTNYLSIMMVSIFIFTPVVVLFWFNDLNINYAQFMTFISVAAIASFLGNRYWGSHCDDYGNKAILWATGYLLALLPLFWYLLKFTPLEYIFPLGIVIQLVSGFSWSGFNLAQGNFLFDIIEPQDRVRLIAYHNSFKSLGMFAGSMIGGFIGGLTMPASLVSYFPSAFYLVMAVSFFARFMTMNFYIGRIAEVREVKHRPHFLHFVAVMPFQGIISESMVGMNRTMKSFRGNLRKIEKQVDYINMKFIRKPRK